MKKQSGFTLIELLLVLAIIGIISAIAIPALLGQRARARDKSATANVDSAIADAIGVWDKVRETGATPAVAMGSVVANLTAAHAKDVNPWNGAAPAYSFSAATGNTYGSVGAFLTAMTVGSLGQAKFTDLYSTSTLPGFIGGAVQLHGAVNGSTTYRKAVAVE
jgi:prepilin-type N-terminal cleavage/methylation domain-containing protein